MEFKIRRINSRNEIMSLAFSRKDGHTRCGGKLKAPVLKQKNVQVGIIARANHKGPRQSNETIRTGSKYM